MSVAGSVRGVTIDGIPYDVASDANLTFMWGRYENDLIPTSGKPMIKKTIRIESIEGIPLVADEEARDQLAALNDQLDGFPLSVTLGSGAEYVNQGTFRIDSWETEENRVTVTLLPREEWVRF